MSTTEISFKARLLIGEEVVPLASEIVIGEQNSQDGVQNGFLFKLDLGPTDPPVQIDLGALIGFIEQQLGAGPGRLQNSNGIGTLQQIFPKQVTGSNFNSQSTVVVDIKNFLINSTTKEFLFQISVDVEGTDPSQGIIPLPAVLANWLTINNLAISFSATTTKS